MLLQLRWAFLNKDEEEYKQLMAELNTVQEELSKGMQEINLTLSEVVELQRQYGSCETTQEELVRKTEEMVIEIATQKLHLEQLMCKLEDLVEEINEKSMEEEPTGFGL